jgi:hypothetical protein
MMNICFALLPKLQLDIPFNSRQDVIMIFILCSLY